MDLLWLALLRTVLRALCNNCDHRPEIVSSERNDEVQSDFSVHKHEVTTAGDFLSADLEDISRNTPVIKYKTVGRTFVLPGIINTDSI